MMEGSVFQNRIHLQKSFQTAFDLLKKGMRLVWELVDCMAGLASVIQGFSRVDLTHMSQKRLRIGFRKG